MKRRHSQRRTTAIALALVTSVLAAAPGYTQNFPAKPVRIVTSEVGGGNDIAARILVPGVSAGLGQQVVVDNRNGVASPELVARALADGYTLHLNGSSLWIAPLLRSGLGYDPIKSFAPVILVDSTPNIVVVPASLSANSIKDLIALAKARPGALNYASGSTGAPTHLGVELFKSMAGVNIVRIPFKGAGPAVVAVVSGEVQMMFASAGSVAAAMKSGKVKALAVTTAEPSALAPGLPTVAASGLPGYEASSVHAIFAPSQTPAAIIKRLNEEFARVLRQSDIKERMLATGVEAVGSTPDAVAAAVKSDMVKMGKVIKEANIHED
jgi:tripartite-type tricarboxylate transporter receptor subunit TctC